MSGVSTGSTGEGGSTGEAAPRRRGARRAQRPATGGVPQVGGPPEQTRDDLPEAVEPQDERARWLQEQRPPHWG